MSSNEISLVEKIRSGYTEKPVSKLDELKMLNQKVKRPAEIFAYIFGGIGALLMGSGMSFIMTDIVSSWSLAMPIGVALGVVGLTMVSVNYFIFNKILAKRKRKYAKQVISLTDELLNKKGE